MLWIKAFHIISVISWMAALLYLPRLMVYHADATSESELSQTLKIMERRLLKVIMTPAMIASWGLGITLLFSIGSFDGWIWMKLIMVIGLTVYHMILARWVKAFEMGENIHSSRFFRIANEIPTVIMVVIVIMVVVKPF